MLNHSIRRVVSLWQKEAHITPRASYQVNTTSSSLVFILIYPPYPSTRHTPLPSLAFLTPALFSEHFNLSGSWVFITANQPYILRTTHSSERGLECATFLSLR